MSTEATCVIREYREADLPAVRDCIVQLQDFERRLDGRLRPGESMAADYLRQMIGRCRDCAGTILVAESDSTVAGFAAILTRVPFEALDDPPGDYAIVTDLAVRDARRLHRPGTAERIAVMLTPLYEAVATAVLMPVRRWLFARSARAVAYDDASPENPR